MYRDTSDVALIYTESSIDVISTYTRRRKKEERVRRICTSDHSKSIKKTYIRCESLYIVAATLFIQEKLIVHSLIFFFFRSIHYNDNLSHLNLCANMFIISVSFHWKKNLYLLFLLVILFTYVDMLVTNDYLNIVNVFF